MPRAAWLRGSLAFNMWTLDSRRPLVLISFTYTSGALHGCTVNFPNYSWDLIMDNNKLLNKTKIGELARQSRIVHKMEEEVTEVLPNSVELIFPFLQHAVGTSQHLYSKEE